MTHSNEYANMRVQTVMCETIRNTSLYNVVKQFCIGDIQCGTSLLNLSSVQTISERFKVVKVSITYREGPPMFHIRVKFYTRQ